MPANNWAPNSCLLTLPLLSLGWGGQLKKKSAIPGSRKEQFNNWNKIKITIVIITIIVVITDHTNKQYAIQLLITHQPSPISLLASDPGGLNSETTVPEERKSQLPTNPHLHTERDTVWYGKLQCPLCVHCPGYPLSQFPGHLQGGMLQSPWFLNNNQRTATYYQHSSHSKSHTEPKTQHFSSY